MDIKARLGNVNTAKTEALAIFLFEDQRKPAGALKALDEVLEGAISALIKKDVIRGKTGEVNIVNTLGRLPYPLLAIVGAGKEKEMDAEGWRRVSGESARALRRLNIESFSLLYPGASHKQTNPEGFGQAIAEGAIMGLYTFRKYLTAKADFREVNTITILAGAREEVVQIKKGIKKGLIMAEAANMARDMVNEPSNAMTPALMAAKAAEIAASHGLELKVLEKEDMRKLGMGAALGVSQGSANLPKFIIMNYRGRPSVGVDLALVGKGVTFDTGGISIKNADKMEEMKADMAGGASVLAAMCAIARLAPAINVMAVVAAVENMPGGRAYKPGDVVRAMNGKTIEVISTDAEGRLTLADALSYVDSIVKASYVIDIATLTGACVIALGHVCSASYTNNQPFLGQVAKAASDAGEKTWQMPMFEEYREQYKSDIADMKNVGGRPAGSITAALFLSEFSGDRPWVHLDIAGVDLAEKEQRYQVKGATGIPTRTLVNLALRMAEKGL
jgi:leucyl aminopeptidase